MRSRMPWGGVGRPSPVAAVVAAVGLALATLLSGCGTRDGAPPADGQRVVTVLAAASLTEPFTSLATAYEKDHPGTRVEVSFGSSTTLAQQVTAGADADVVAFAGTSALTRLPAGVADQGGRATIATNTLEIATPPGNPAKVRTLADLARSDVDVVLCGATVPCGTAADAVLAKAGVSAHVVSRDTDVKSTLAKVRLGEADAAVVYHSDIVSAGAAVTGVPIPASANTTLDYPMIWLDRDPATTAFVDLVRGEAGRAALSRAGFLTP